MVKVVFIREKMEDGVLHIMMNQKILKDIRFMGKHKLRCEEN